MPFIGKENLVGQYALLDSITTDGSFAYAMQIDGSNYEPETERNMIVSVNGVTQAPVTSYTISGHIITFSEALTSDDSIDYVLILGHTLDIGTPSDNTVGTTALQDGAVTNAKITSMAASKLTGAMPAIDGSALTGIEALPDAIEVETGAASNTLLIEADGDVTLGANLNVQHIIPQTDLTYDLGSASKRFNDLYLSGNTINLGDATITADGSTVTIGSITLGSSLTGDGSGITSINADRLSSGTIPSARFPDDLSLTANLAVGGSITATDDLKFDTSVHSGSHPSHQEGLVWYDSIHNTLNYYSDVTNVVHELGIEEHQRVYNDSGNTISKGQPLYFSGNYTAGTIDVPTVGLADATDVNAYNAQGLAAADIPNNSYGYCIIAGQLDGLDTSGLSAGTNYFVGLGPGLVQNASPLYPNYPMCLGWVVNSDATNGVLLVNQQNHSVNSFRVRTSAHIGTDLRVDGNLTVIGSSTTTSTSDVTTGTTMFRLNEGDAIGEAGTTFSGTGLDDAFFSGHFTGTAETSYYLKIDGVGTGTGGVDTFALSTDNFSTTISTGNDITGAKQLIHSADNIYVDFGATTGHTLNDQWTGTATPVEVDTGFWSNRNTGTSGVGYTHMGLFYDVTEAKWSIVDEYDPTPSGAINTAHASYNLATLKASTFEGNVTGDLTGTIQTASQTNITAVGDLASLKVDGNLGLGIATPSGNVKQHIHQDDSTGVWVQFTNATTGTAGGDGALVGFNSAEVFNIRNYHNTALQFWTKNTERLYIKNDGKVGINTTSPVTTTNALLDVRSGYIVAGTGASTSGTKILAGYYNTSGDEAVTIGTSRSSAALVLGYGVYPDTASLDTFLSSADNVGWSRGALTLDDELVFRNAGSATVTVGSSVTLTERFRVNTGGNLTISGTLTESSALRYKENVQDLEYNDIISQLKPKIYNKIGQEEREVGLIAEDVAALDDTLVTYRDGEIEGIQYTRLVPHLIAHIQKLEERLERVENG